MKKTFIVCMFGSTFSWFDDFVKQVAPLASYGWKWLVVTPNQVTGSENVKIVRMTTEEFNELVNTTLGVKPNVFTTQGGIPSVHMTDFYPFSGLIFQDYLYQSDWWGIMNLDVVVGRLDHFITDEELDKYDVWTDDVNVINGVFCLFRNRDDINRLCLEIENWQEKLTQGLCRKCLGIGRTHHLYGTDEYDLTDIMRRPDILEKVRYGYPKYYPLHSHDRLEQHVPNIKLEVKEDGSLWELYEDMHSPTWVYAHPFLGREIAYFHFIRSKEWPKCLKEL